MGSGTRLTLLLLGDAAGLAWSATAAPPVVHILAAAAHRAPQIDDLVGALATAVLLVAIWYLVLVLLLCALARLPGLAGRFGRRLSAALVPAILRRVVAGVAGIGVVV